MGSRRSDCLFATLYLSKEWLTYMKIGIDACCWSNKRGYGRFTRELLRAIARLDKSSEYILFCDHETGVKIDLEGNFKKVVVSTSRSVNKSAGANSYRSPIDLMRMSLAVFKEKLDWFYSPSVYSFFPVLNRCKIAVTIHDTIAELYPYLNFPTWRDVKFWNAKVFFACRQADLIFTVSAFARASIERVLKVPGEKIQILLEAPDMIFTEDYDPKIANLLMKRLGIDEQEPFFIYVGGINPHKNLKGLIEAFSVEDFSKCKLLLVGDYETDNFFSDLKNVQRLITEKSLTNRVLLTGYLSDIELVQLFKRAIALILPSFYEGFGLPALEAMAAGAPVIATQNSAIPEIAPDGAIYFDPEDTGSLKNAMACLLNDKELRKRLSTLGKNYAERHSWDATAERFLELLLESR
jgi:glycosyltransferase involved in cell wall biosynthesis